MGWNQGYEILEQIVIGAYDLGKLDKDLLEVIIEPFKGSDLDCGGSTALTTHDDKDLEEVVVEIITNEKVQKPKNTTNDDYWEYLEKINKSFSTIMKTF